MKGHNVVLVIPAEDIYRIPLSNQVLIGDAIIEFSAFADSHGLQGGTKGGISKTKTTIKKLRRLADFLEEMVDA